MSKILPPFNAYGNYMKQENDSPSKEGENIGSVYYSSDSDDEE
jgi:hypothetical protein